MPQNESNKIGRLNFSRLKEALKNVENEASYYAGGTLFIDFKDMPCVGLNLDGRGFTFHPEATDNVRAKFVMTNEMTQLVRSIYLKHKGKTEYYDGKVRDPLWLTNKQ